MGAPNDIIQQSIMREGIVRAAVRQLQRAPQAQTGEPQPIDLLTIDVFTREMEKLLKATQRRARFLTLPFITVAGVPQLLREREVRTYFYLTNTGANTLFVGYDQQPTAITGSPLAPGAFAEPYQVPDNDIWVMSTLATTGALIYAIGND